MCLKQIQESRRKYCDKLRKLTGINVYWIIDNNDFILEEIAKLNKKKQAKSVTTYDFANMYTNLDHDGIIEEISQIIKSILKNKFGFTIRGKKAIICKKEDCEIDQDHLIELLKFVVKNTYFRCGDIIYKQIHGIPMGTACAPQIANLYLHSLEYKYMMKIIRTNRTLAQKLSLTGRYIDDLTNINGHEVFDKIKGQIYPSSLDLIRQNTTTKQADVLDISIEVCNKSFITKLYDKRRAFTFESVCFPSPKGNIPENMCYNVFQNQILRYAKICSKIEDFLDNISTLMNYLMKRGYSKRRMKWNLKKLRKNSFILERYKNDPEIKKL